MEPLKELFLNKLSLRLIYIVTAFLSSKLLTLAASSKFLSYSKDSGFVFEITDQEKFKTSLMTCLLIGGEFVYHFVHTKFILPHVSPAFVVPPETLSLNPIQQQGTVVTHQGFDVPKGEVK